MFPFRTLLTALLVPACMAADSIQVYFGTSSKESKGIYRAAFNTKNGKLTKPIAVAEIRNPGFLAMNAARTRLYAVATLNEPVVASYAIEGDGALSLLSTAVIGDGGAAHISVHPSGRFLLTAQYGGGSTAVFPIADDGAVQERSQLIEHTGGSKVVGKRQNSPHPHWTGYSPDGAYAFVPDLGTDRIHIYKVDAEKASLSPHGHAESVAGGGPRHMRFSTDGRFIYLLNELSLSLTTFSYDAATGTTERLSTTPALSEETKAKEGFNSASEILVHPNGKFVYSANRGNDSVTVYAANSQTGGLSVREVEPVRGSWPRNINLDPTANWLLAAGAHSNSVAVFAIDGTTGELTFQTRGIVNVPGPICILFWK
jgi:6-phosphogluconolactonase